VSRPRHVDTGSLKKRLPVFLFGKSSWLCDAQLRVTIAESQHLYTCADYHWIVKTIQVVTTIINYNNDTYDLVSLAQALIKGEVTATGAYLNVEA